MFDVRTVDLAGENRVDVARFLLEHDHNPIDLWVDDDALEIARRGA